MSDSPPSIFDHPDRKKHIQKAQAEWDARMRQSGEILREGKQRNKPRGRKPRGSL